MLNYFVSISCQHSSSFIIVQTCNLLTNLCRLFRIHPGRQYHARFVQHGIDDRNNLFCILILTIHDFRKSGPQGPMMVQTGKVHCFRRPVFHLSYCLGNITGTLPYLLQEFF